MKRWLLTLDHFNNQPKIYAKNADEAKNFFNNENVLSVEPYENYEYLNYINRIKDMSELLASHSIRKNNIREWYKYVTSDGILRIRLYKDMRDDLYYDIAEYQYISNDCLVFPCTFTYSNPTDVYDLFFKSMLSCEIPIYRFYGQPKLKKPKELTGIKQSFSVDWIPKKCTCQCFVTGDDLWIKHRDFFSASHKPAPENNGTPLNYRLQKYFGVNKSYLDRFIYADCWGDIVLRNEVWIVFRNLKQTTYKDKHLPITSMLKEFSKSDLLKKSYINVELNEDWYRFFENVYKKYFEFIKNT